MGWSIYTGENQFTAWRSLDDPRCLRLGNPATLVQLAFSGKRRRDSRFVLFAFDDSLNSDYLVNLGMGWGVYTAKDQFSGRVSGNDPITLRFQSSAYSD
jgi:hypothetical protein